jgi:hypothetical protein
MHDVPVSQMPPNYGLEVKPRVAAHEDAANNSLFVCYPFITRPPPEMYYTHDSVRGFPRPSSSSYVSETNISVGVGREILSDGVYCKYLLN